MKAITEQKAKDVAIAIIDIFEDLFDEKDIFLPDEERGKYNDFDNDEFEACIYGKTYYDIEDYFTKLILDNFENLQTDDSFLDLAEDMIFYINEILKDVEMEIIEGERQDAEDNEPICRTTHGFLIGRIVPILENTLFPDTKTSIKNVDGYRITSSIVIPYDKFKEDFKKATGDNDVHMYIDIDGIVINSSVKNYYHLLAEYFGVKEVTSIHADDDPLYINVWVSFVK